MKITLRLIVIQFYLVLGSQLLISLDNYMCEVHALLTRRRHKHLEPLHVMSLILSPGTKGAVLGLLLCSS